MSNVGYLTDLAREYERLTGAKIYVRGGGSVVGIEDLRRGRVDFAAACRAKDTGDPADVRFVQVAWDVLVFIVNKNNPLDSISSETVREIYSGKVTNWKTLNSRNAPIKLFISRPKKGLSGVEASMKSLVLQNRDPFVTPNTFLVASAGIAEQMVENTPDGFSTTGYSSARKRKIKMLKVDGAAPTAQNIIMGRYPMKRPLFLITAANPKASVRKFVDFALSSHGQQFIRSLGVVALSDIKVNH